MKKSLKLLSLGFLSLFLLAIAMPSNAAILPFCTYTGNCQTCDFAELFINLANYGFTMIGGVALFMFVIGGIYLVMGGSNTESLTRGKQIITAAIVGMIIVLSAFLIVNFVVTAIAGSENINLSNDKEQPWYKAPGCTKIKAGDGTRGPLKEAGECKKLELKNPKIGTDEYDKLQECKSIFSIVRDGAPCRPSEDFSGSPNKLNGVIIELSNGDYKCVSECYFLSEKIERVYENYRCVDTAGWDDKKKEGIKCEAGLCPGSDDWLCCDGG